MTCREIHIDIEDKQVRTDPDRAIPQMDTTNAATDGVHGNMYEV